MTFRARWIEVYLLNYLQIYKLFTNFSSLQLSRLLVRKRLDMIRFPMQYYVSNQMYRIKRVFQIE